VTARSRTWVLLAPLALLLVPFLLWPALFGLVASFTSYGPFETRVRIVGLDNYAAILADPQFTIGSRNVIAFTAAAVTAELALGFAIAYLLREPFRGRALVRIALLVPWLVSPVANGVLWHFLLSPSVGLLDFLGGLAGFPLGPSPLGVSGLALPTAIATDVWRKAPLVGFLVLPGILAIPHERWESATLEGARLVDRIRHIALPPLAPLLLTIAMLLVGDTLGTFDSVLILTGGGPGSETLTPGLYAYEQAFRANDWRLGATAGWLVGASVLLVGAAYIRAMRGERR
jgi:multiple sugar transport system permease protein